MKTEHRQTRTGRVKTKHKKLNITLTPSYLSVFLKHKIGNYSHVKFHYF